MMYFKFHRSLATILLLPSLMALLPVIALFWWLAQIELNQELAQKKNDLLTTSSELNERFSYQIRQAEIALQTLAQSPILQKLERASCQERVEQHFHVLNHALANLLVLNPQGQVICNAKAPDKLHNLSERTYYQRAMQSQQFAVGDFNVGKTTGTHIIGMAYPFIKDNRIKMLTATSLELSTILASFEAVLKGTNLELSMLDANGVVLAHWQKNQQLVPIGTQAANTPLGRHLLNQPNEYFFELPDLLGDTSYFAYQPLRYKDQTYGYIALSYHVSDLEEITTDYRHFQLFIIVLIFIVSMTIAGLMLHRLVSRRLKPMMQVVERLGRGELGVQLPINASQDELTQLALRFNAMSNQLAKQQEHLYHVAYYDLLTGIHNKHFLQEQVEKLLNDQTVNAFDLILMDLDNFRLINDSLGHDKGDQLLITIANRLKPLCQEAYIFAHLGADEFALVIKHADLNTILLHLNHVKQILGENISIDNYDLSMTASMGVASYPEDANTFVSLLQHADAALHKSKQEGKNQYQFYSSEMKQQLARQLSLENGLRNALINHQELMLYYQPQVQNDGRMRSFEALIRWQHPQLGIISPAEFIPIAEQSALIVNVGSWVLNHACQQLSQWLAAGFDITHVSVNVSAMQLHVGDLHAEVKQAISRSGIMPDQLELEITESFIIKYPEHAINVLIQLKQLGVRLAMDDFGTGYSSLLYLKRLPLDCIKVDQGFVRNMLDDPHDAAIVSAVVALGHSFDLKIVAEGVETEAHAQYLRNIGCDLLQGYLFSRPVPAETASRFLSKIQ
jgi:diguanylate cyclase (GGDEF)-like protein